MWALRELQYGPGEKHTETGMNKIINDFVNSRGRLFLSQADTSIQDLSQGRHTIHPASVH